MIFRLVQNTIQHDQVMWFVHIPRPSTSMSSGQCGLSRFAILYVLQVTAEVVMNISEANPRFSMTLVTIKWIPAINGCFQNNDTPKSSILIRFSIVNHPFWGTPIFGSTPICNELTIWPRLKKATTRFFWNLSWGWRVPGRLVRLHQLVQGLVLEKALPTVWLYDSQIQTYIHILLIHILLIPLRLWNTYFTILC